MDMNVFNEFCQTIEASSLLLPTLLLPLTSSSSSSKPNEEGQLSLSSITAIPTTMTTTSTGGRGRGGRGRGGRGRGGRGRGRWGVKKEPTITTTAAIKIPTKIKINKKDNDNVLETKRRGPRKDNNNNEFIQPSRYLELSSRDKAPQLILSNDRLTCYGVEGGYRMVRASHGVHNGAYYMEIQVLPSDGPDAHIRVGWSTRLAELQAPVGYDKYSYAYRDINGSKVHQSKRDDSYGDSYGPGDIIGCFIDLNEYCNEIRFFKNGKDQGVAYSGKEIPQSVYYPAVSLYMKAIVSVNFGPSFIIKPETSHIFTKIETGTSKIPISIIPVSELQPMSPDDRKVHEARISAIKERRLEIEKQNNIRETNNQAGE